MIEITGPEPAPARSPLDRRLFGPPTTRDGKPIAYAGSLDTVVKTFRGAIDLSRPRVAEIPRRLQPAELRNLPELPFEVGLNIHQRGIYVVEGNAEHVVMSSSVLVNSDQAIINLHSHPTPTLGPRELGYFSGNDAKSVDNTVDAVISESGMAIYGWPRYIPDGVSVGSTNPDPRDLLAGYAEREGLSFFQDWPPGTRYIGSLTPEEGDQFMIGYGNETGALITKIAWSETDRVDGAIEIFNTTTDSTDAREKFASL